ncbi:MAG: DUF927 domain-containing protein [Chloroflexi bacterium]|nr:DUF927 domain-containing protein [Chloroflexota bacterium]
MTSDQTQLMRAALWYGRLGWYVLPLHNPANGICSCSRGKECSSSGKHPRIAAWEHAASTDARTISAWWQRWPQANIGIAAGKSGLVVIDIDTYHGGALELDAAERATITSLTGGGGEHLIYTMPPGLHLRNTDAPLPGGVNVRGFGGQFVAPPSRHASDRQYAWAEGRGPQHLAPAPLPPRLLELFSRAASPAATPHERAPGRGPGGDIISAGGRNNALVSLGGWMRRRGMSADAILAALAAENQARCRPPLPAGEVALIAHSVMRYPAAAQHPTGSATILVAGAPHASETLALPGAIAANEDGAPQHPTGSATILGAGAPHASETLALPGGGAIAANGDGAPQHPPGSATILGAGVPHTSETLALPGASSQVPMAGVEALLADLGGLAAGGAADKLAVEARAIELIRQAAYLDTPDLLRLGHKLRALGLSHKSVDRWRQAVKEAQQALPMPQPGQHSAWREQHPHWPYAIAEGRMVVTHITAGGELQQAPICNFTARIVEEAVAEDGMRWFTLAGQTTAQYPFKLELPAEEFSDPRRLRAALVGAAGAKGTVMAGMAEHLAPAISTLTDGDLRRRQRFSRTGWHGASFLIPGREPEGVSLQLMRKLPYDIDGRGDWRSGLAALESLFQLAPAGKAAVIAAFLFQGPLAALLDWRNERYGLFITGRSGTFKTSLAQCGMSLYGAGFLRDDLLIKWGEGATRNAIMALATYAHDLPLLIDNYKPSTGDGARGFINLMHNLLEGGEKDRLSRAAEIKETNPSSAGRWSPARMCPTMIPPAWRGCW